MLPPARFLTEIWPILPFHLRFHLYLICFLDFHKVIFAYTARAAFWIIVLMLTLPSHPMTLPTAIGGGLSFAMLSIPEK